MKITDEQRDVLILTWQQKARRAGKKKKPRNLYVITLDPEVLWRREFRQENPGYIEGMPCVYVGMTIHEPGDRYQQHKVGYSIELAQELIDGFDGTGLSDEQQEAALAEWLRGQGMAVWQN